MLQSLCLHHCLGGKRERTKRTTKQQHYQLQYSGRGNEN
jgi:hypothetical protein